MNKRRKLNIKNLIIMLVLLISIVVLIVLGIKTIISIFTKDEEISEVIEKEEIKEEIKEFDFDLYSKQYILVDVDENKILYGKGIDEKIAPASLTKVLTLDAVVNNVNNFLDRSYYSHDDFIELADANASLAGLEYDNYYSIDEYLYALILPSGADGARGLEKYFLSKDINLIQEMNRICDRLGLKNSYFTNPVGLDDINLYTSLNDYSKIVLDTLNNEKAASILETLTVVLNDDITLKSTLLPLSQRDDKVTVLGGKTGYTGNAGENILVIYKVEEKTYFLVLAGANGNPYSGEFYHMDDVNTIFENLYK